jgi:hypothetical protein
MQQMQQAAQSNQFLPVLAMFPQALEHVAEAADSDEEEAEPAEPTYVQEQQDLKRNFLQARHCLQLVPAACSAPTDSLNSPASCSYQQSLVELSTLHLFS